MPKNSSVLNGVAPQGTWGARTGDGQNVQKLDCIFPIMKQTASGQFQLVGTGFYICMQSVFITATHVLKDVLDKTGKQKEAIGIFHFSKDGKYMMLPILWAWHSTDADISIGKAAPAYHNITKQPLMNSVVTLTQRQPNIGEQAVTYAYPDFNREQNGKTQELYFRPHYYDGKIQEFYSKGRGTLMPWPHYRTDIHLHGASSGGPVFDKFGRVFAINCKSYDPQTDISFVTPIDAALNGYIEGARFSENEVERKITIKELIGKGHIVLNNE